MKSREGVMNILLKNRRTPVSNSPAIQFPINLIFMVSKMANSQNSPSIINY